MINVARLALQGGSPGVKSCASRGGGETRLLRRFSAESDVSGAVSEERERERVPTDGPVVLAESFGELAAPNGSEVGQPRFDYDRTVAGWAQKRRLRQPGAN